MDTQRALTRTNAPPKSRLWRAAEVIWIYYSVVSALFLIGLLIDLIYIWSVAYHDGVTLYVNNFGEGNTETLIFIITIPWLAITLVRDLGRVRPAEGRRWLAAEEWKAEQARKFSELPVGTEFILGHSNSPQLEGKVVVVVSQRKRYVQARLKDDPTGKTFFVPHTDFWRVKGSGPVGNSGDRK